MSTKTPECWASDPQSRALRIEASPDCSLLLPHDHFLFSELTNDGKEQRLRLMFDSHEVVVRGHALRRLETVMQRQELSFIAAVANAARSLAADNQPAILEIVVKEVGVADQAAPESPE